MPNSPSAKKSLRQNEKRHERNQASKSQMRTELKKALTAVKSGDAERATAQVRAAESALDKSAKRGLLHKRCAARRKSRLAKRLNALSASK